MPQLRVQRLLNVREKDECVSMSCKCVCVSVCKGQAETEKLTHIWLRSQAKSSHTDTHRDKYDIPMSTGAIRLGFNGTAAQVWLYWPLSHKVKSLNMSQSSWAVSDLLTKRHWLNDPSLPRQWSCVCHKWHQYTVESKEKAQQRGTHHY